VAGGDRWEQDVSISRQHRYKTSAGAGSVIRNSVSQGKRPADRPSVGCCSSARNGIGWDELPNVSCWNLKPLLLLASELASWP